jgi:hypothetical protein
MQRILTNLLFAIAVFQLLTATTASAQATRTWISGVGDDANPCSRTAPCKTFAGAISKTAPAGEINVLDPGGFGTVTITKAITLRSDSVEAGVLVSGTNGIVVNAGATDRVVIDGLDIEGLSNQTSLNGVNIIQAADVLIKDSSIRGFNSASGAGVLINAISACRVTIEHSVINNNTFGVLVTSNGGAGHSKIFDNLILNNASAGIRVIGAGNDAIILNNKVLGSPKSLDIVSGGAVASYGGNLLTSGDAPTTSNPMQ